jgi:hypothetical protein
MWINCILGRYFLDMLHLSMTVMGYILQVWRLELWRFVGFQIGPNAELWNNEQRTDWTDLLFRLLANTFLSLFSRRSSAMTAAPLEVGWWRAFSSKHQLLIRLIYRIDRNDARTLRGYLSQAY